MKPLGYLVLICRMKLYLCSLLKSTASLMNARQSIRGLRYCPARLASESVAGRRPLCSE
jgi:hypothetical protein